ncbi:hypothetical protein ACTM7U_14730 [Citrobacter braakii]
MADFSATKRNSSLQDWGEALECMVELNGKDFDITEMEIEAAYEALLTLGVIDQMGWPW